MLLLFFSFCWLQTVAWGAICEKCQMNDVLPYFMMKQGFFSPNMHFHFSFHTPTTSSHYHSHFSWRAQEKQTATVPQKVTLLKAIKSNSKLPEWFQIIVLPSSRHNQSQSGCRERGKPATPIPTQSQIVIFSQTPTRSSAQVHRRKRLKFTRDEKETETAFDKVTRM